MSKQDLEDRAFWKRIAKMLGTHLHGWTYRHHASFVNPQKEVDGTAAALLVEQEDEIIRLKGELAAERFNNA